MSAAFQNELQSGQPGTNWRQQTGERPYGGFADSGERWSARAEYCVAVLAVRAAQAPAATFDERSLGAATLWSGSEQQPFTD